MLEAGSTVKQRVLLVFASMIFAQCHGALKAQDVASNLCQRPSAGSAVGEPEDLRSRNGKLKADLTIHNFTGADGSSRYCYVDSQGNQSPNLRLKPGDLLILRLKNDLKASDSTAINAGRIHTHLNDAHMTPDKNGDACVAGSMTASSTNLHFHGLTVPPVCHEDDVLKTSIGPGDPPFEYRFRIPEDEPPGL